MDDYVDLDVTDVDEDLKWVAFAVWDDDTAALEDWIANFDWESAATDMPNYEVFGGFVGFFEEPEQGEGIAVMLYSEDLPSNSYWGISATNFMDGQYSEAGTKTIPLDGIPTGDDWIWADVDVESYNAEGTWENDYAGGFNSEFGSEFHIWEEEDGVTTQEFAFWHYNNGVEGNDFFQGDYEIIVIHTHADGDTVWFEDVAGIYNLSGATQLAAATIAAATAFAGLI